MIAGGDEVVSLPHQGWRCVCVCGGGNHGRGADLQNDLDRHYVFIFFLIPPHTHTHTCILWVALGCGLVRWDPEILVTFHYEGASWGVNSRGLTGAYKTIYLDRIIGPDNGRINLNDTAGRFIGSQHLWAVS